MQDQSEGKKFDGGKPRYSLLPQGTIEEVLRVLEHGARKYAPENWKKVPDARTRYYDAAMRHVAAWWQGDQFDNESNEAHLAHAVCCLLFLMWLDKQDVAKAFMPPGTWVEVTGFEFK